MESGIVASIFENYTKARPVLSEWFKSNFYGGEALTNKDINNLAAESLDKFIMLIMANSNPRFLYDFFDSVAIFITVNKQVDGWKYVIDGDQGLSASFEHRPIAEQGAFQKAFSLLENKL